MNREEYTIKATVYFSMSPERKTTITYVAIAVPAERFEYKTSWKCEWSTLMFTIIIFQLLRELSLCSSQTVHQLFFSSFK
jgi:hypothetical protein